MKIYEKTKNHKKVIDIIGRLWYNKENESRGSEMGEKLICNVCGKNEALGVCCVPSVPCSMAYCKECLEANAHPWGILVANTACCNGLENTADFWKEMVEDTCKHLGRTIEEFNNAVAIDMVTMAGYSDLNEDENEVNDGNN